MDLKTFFEAKSIAVIGASRSQNKAGHVIFRNFIDVEYEKFGNKIFPINSQAEEILGRKSYSSVLDVKDEIDLAIIAIPAQDVLDILKECAKKGIKHVVIISSGFSEIGNEKEEEKISKFLEEKKMFALGVNCLGILDAYTQLDTIFTPRSRLQRPKKGCISLICQSGAVGSTLVDLMAREGYGLAKFISYGNATSLTETDFLEYLGEDENTKVICVYIEGLKNGRRFLEVAKKVSVKKPIIAIKAGVTQEGSKAVKSHTGALAGDAEIYTGIFKQGGIIQASNIEEMFDSARMLEKSVKPRGCKIQIITNGGGYGILTVDAIIKNKLQLAEMDQSIQKQLKKQLLNIAVIGNPIDLTGSATTEHYKAAIDACLEDKEVNIVLVIMLPQTPLITTEIVDVIIEAKQQAKKPICVVSVGGEFTELLKKDMEQQGVPCFSFPLNAANALREFCEYYSAKK